MYKRQQYVIDVFEVITFDDISKPITVEKLESVRLKAMQYLHMIKRDFVFQFRKNQFRDVYKRQVLILGSPSGIL